MHKLQAIGFAPFKPEVYRKNVAEMPDQKLLYEGKRLRQLIDRGLAGTEPGSKEMLEICREEWRRRHPRK